MIVLHEHIVDSQLGEFLLMVGFRKKSARIGMGLRLDK